MSTLDEARIVTERLRERGVEAVLFGSLGVSVYLGAFKEFEDIDLIVPPEWTSEKWAELKEIMRQLTYRLVNEREHEFSGPGSNVAFAPMSIFEHDEIKFHEGQDIVEIELEGNTIKTFTPELFMRTYEFSAKDGYRIRERGKKDRLVIDMLTRYIWSKKSRA